MKKYLIILLIGLATTCCLWGAVVLYKTYSSKKWLTNHRQQGLSAEAAGKWQNAEKIYREILVREPTDASLWVRVAEIEADSGDYVEAEKDFQKAAKLSPNSGRVFAGLSRVYSLLKMPKQSLVAIEKAVQLEPSNVKYLWSCAEIANWNVEYSVAVDSYQRLLQLMPGNDELLLRMARVESWRRANDKAAGFYREFLKKHPDNGEGLLELVQVELWRGNYSESLNLLEKYRLQEGITDGYLKKRAQVLARTDRQQAAFEINNPLQKDKSTGEKKGTLALAFDDGYPSWITIIAPELASVGGVATGYVNNFRLHEGSITFNDILSLQNRYGWEIGTHTYNHYDPDVYVRVHGLEVWLEKELDLSIRELRDKGLNVRSLVFPFNKSTQQLQAEVLKRVAVFRRNSLEFLAYGMNKDGSVPGRALDLGHHVPVKIVKKWIDEAHEDNQILFIYGHQVLPDDEFVSGEVASISTQSLVSKTAIPHLNNSYLCLVPDLDKEMAFTLLVESVTANTITISNGDLNRYTKPGASFMVGPCMGLKLFDFHEIIRYASEKLQFKTISDAVSPPVSHSPQAGKTYKNSEKMSSHSRE